MPSSPTNVSCQQKTYKRLKGSNAAWVQMGYRDWPLSLTLSSEGKVSPADSPKPGPGQYKVTPYRVWKKNIVLGRNTEAIVEGYDATYEYRSVVPGAFGYQIYLDALLSVEPAITSNIGNYYDRALAKAYAKLGTSAAAIGETLGEFRETLKMIKDPFKALSEFLASGRTVTKGQLIQELRLYIKNDYKTYVKNGRVYRGRAAFDAASATWLEVRYGLLPLIYTMQDVMEMVHKKVKAFDPNAIKSVKGNLLTSAEFGTPSKSYGYFSNLLTTKMEGKGTDTIRAHASVQYKMSSANTFLAQLGLAPQFAPELAWELTRLSFVVDWWFDIGTWLGTLRATPNIVVLGNTVSIKVERKIEVIGSSSLGLFIPKKNYDWGVVCTQHYKYFDRVVNRNLPLLPLWKLDFKSWLHVVDAASLIIQGALKLLRIKN